MTLEDGQTLDVVAEIRTMLNALLLGRQDVTDLATVGRSKFEQWLKFEMAASLAKHGEFSDVAVEQQYGAGAEKADIAFTVNDTRWFVELKTPNTSWRARGVEVKTKNVTDNISEVIVDMAKLRRNCPPDNGLSVFVLFPVPTRIWTGEQSKMNLHLDRIEGACKLNQGELLQNANFVALSPDYGVVPFVIKVV